MLVDRVDCNLAGIGRRDRRMHPHPPEPVPSEPWEMDAFRVRKWHPPNSVTLHLHEWQLTNVCLSHPAALVSPPVTRVARVAQIDTCMTGAVACKLGMHSRW